MKEILTFIHENLLWSFACVFMVCLTISSVAESFGTKSK